MFDVLCWCGESVEMLQLGIVFAVRLLCLIKVHCRRRWPPQQELTYGGDESLALFAAAFT